MAPPRMEPTHSGATNFLALRFEPASDIALAFGDVLQVIDDSDDCLTLATLSS
jgi:hypothetical protein